MKGDVGRFLDQRLRSLCEWKDVEVLEMNVMEDHIHMVVTIPPKVSISELMGILKGKTAISMFKSFPVLKKKPYWGNHFWSRGYCVTTVGLDEEKIRRYVKYQEENEKIEEDNQQEFGLFQRPPTNHLLWGWSLMCAWHDLFADLLDVIRK